MNNHTNKSDLDDNLKQHEIKTQSPEDNIEDIADLYNTILTAQPKVPKGERPCQGLIKQLKSWKKEKTNFLESLTEEQRDQLLCNKEKTKKKVCQPVCKYEKRHQKALEALQNTCIVDEKDKIVELVDIGINLDGRSELQKVLERAQTAGVTKILLTGTTISNSKQNYETYNKFQDKTRIKLYGTCGIHPCFIDSSCIDDQEKLYEELKSVASHPFFVSIGECGLDYEKMQSSERVQKLVFELQVKLAVELQKPLFLHIRENSSHTAGAYDDAIEILNRCGVDPQKVCIHCFTGTNQELQKLIDNNFNIIGITGYITMKSKAEMSGTVDAIHNCFDAISPNLMIETDAPYLLPTNAVKEMKVFQENEPANLPQICRSLYNQVVKDKTDLTLAEFAKQTSKNAIQLFNL